MHMTVLDFGTLTYACINAENREAFKREFPLKAIKLSQEPTQPVTSSFSLKVNL